ncbi:TonB-dependent receptor family protein [Hydrocarboniphaga sp.]|uniref:TonB-dependent receptor family protein n=1 Tax=Hydrocarboniphaga sp. TaxID=2033016 RepID=UPI003D0E48A6
MRRPVIASACRIAGGLIAVAASSTVGAQSGADTQAPAELETVTVTATRLPSPAFDVPASIDSVGGDDLHGNSLGVNLSEALPSIAGLLARDRQNYAQDTQISIRGFGSRSTFGVRGVRLYLDGIPATQPDGQGQVSHFNMGSADRVEVLRGPFSAMYGNSSGGVIQMFTADGSDEPIVSGSVAGGSFGTWRSSIGVRASLDPAKTIDYNVNYAAFHTDGFRDHSEARRQSFNGKVGWQLSTDSKLTFVLNSFSAPNAQDPLGLTRAQFDDKPSQATSVATQFNTRKSADQTQGGAIYDWRISDTQSLRVLGYYGERNVEQYLAIPISAQANPRHSGGVVDLGTDYGGSDARWTYADLLGGRRFSLVAGVSYDDLSQQRRGYNDYIGTQLGVKGALRRDETDQVYDFDQYLQASYDFADRWSALAGVRHSSVKFDSDDHYLANGDDSGKADYSATTPVAGVVFKPTDALRFYGAYGEGFETPTFAELAYTNGSAGLNFGLDPAKTRNAEVGMKLRLRPKTEFDLAVFQAKTNNELAIASNSGGRSTYLNIGHTRRQGVESSLTTELVRDLRLQLAYTWLDATVRDDYQTCSGTPCTVLNATVDSGSQIPGVPKSSAYGALNWGKSAGWNAELDARYIGKVAVNDVNSESAPSYSLFGAGLGYIFELPHWRVRNFIRVDNLLDKDYVGSVIVNDGNGRYYEPGPGRSVLAGVNLDWKY